ncbi:MAG TPA: hypothetical protein VFK57_11960 [Vicinamibacterales bacterium]|nr:hypothetical protein [Vicinamibacterales bacterium]
MRALSLILVTTLACSGPAYAQRAEPDRAAAAEFPACEFTLLNTYQRGLRLTAAARALSREPDSIDTLALLLATERLDAAIAAAGRLVAASPDRFLPALTLLAQHNHRFRDGARGHAGAMREIARQARLRLGSLDREDAARAARQILMFDPGPASPAQASTYEQAIATFLQEYAGTEEARLTEVDQLMRGRPSYEQVDALEAFARAHRGTAAGAKALYSAAHQLSVNVPITGVERRGSDPTERFVRVLAMVKELESGAYPRGEWVDRASELVAGLFASNPAIAPANVERLEAEYAAFAKSHIDADGPDPAESRIGYLLTTKLAELHKTQGDPVPRVERVLDRLAGETGRADFAFMKARFYLRTAVNETGRRAAMRQKARDALGALIDAGTGLYHRKSLATLACLEFEDRDYGGALEHFTGYVRRYPSSPYAWLAALRVGATQAAMGDWRSAAASYRAAARYDVPIARMLGHEHAARSLEALDESGAALREHEAALAAWDPNFAGYSARDLVLGGAPNLLATAPVSFEPPAPIDRDALTARVAQLRASLAHPSGPLLERGRWLLQQERRVEAAETLARLLREYPRSPLAGEARALSHHARLETALIAANVEAAAPDPAAALAQLTQLIREPYDDAVCIAGIARATLLARDRIDEARTAMRTALAQCRTGSAGADAGAPSALDSDVLAVRNTVFRPLGGGIYATDGWDSHRWPSAPPPFLLVSGTVTVKTSDGQQTEVRVRRPVPGLDNVVFVSGDQLRLLNTVMTALGGTRRFAPASVMSTPNQPAGAALDVLAFWRQFFPAMPGHWGGWEFEAFPRINRIDFLDAARTRAAVPVTIGYSGATIVLEKRDGVWRMLELTNRWIT